MEIDFRPSPDLYPFTSRWFESSVGRIHYIDEGSGRPLVLLHGNPTWSFLYREIVRRISDKFRCIAPDYPGFGLSTRPEDYRYAPPEHAAVIGELLDRLDISDAILMGQDWGGPIGAGIAVKNPGRITGLVMGNTTFWPVDLWSVKLFSKLMSTRLLQRQILQRNLFVERLIPLGSRRKLSEDEMDHYRGVQPTPEARVGVAEFPRQLLAAKRWLAGLAQRVPQELGSKQVLLVWGMKDRAFPARHFLRGWLRTFPHADVVELPNAAHFIQEDAPGEIADAIAKRFG